MNPIDPRTATEEHDSPVYRVYFIGEGGATDEWQVHGASSVEEVQSWALNDGRAFDLFAEWPRPMGPGLLRLSTAQRG